MKILVTGGAGLVGSHCAEYFAKNPENNVVVLDNLMRSKIFGYDKASVEYNWDYLKKYKNIELIKGDVRSDKDVKKAIDKDVDIVIHTAGQPGVPSSVRVPLDDFSINAFGTLNVLECLRKKADNSAFIYTSTNKVYGENVDKIPVDEVERRYFYAGMKNTSISESMPVDMTGHTPYGVSKLVGDLYTQEYGHMYNMNTAVFRMSCIYGTRQFGMEEQGWVAWFIIATLLGKPITIYGNGKQVRDMLYVTDLVAAFDAFVQRKERIRHVVYNMGGGIENTISLVELLDYLEEITGKRAEVSYADWRPSDQKVYISDITKAKKELDWAPKVNPKDGVKKLINWVKENKKLF